MPRWLRITTLCIAAGVGLAGAMLDYSKAATMLALFAIVLPIEGINYLIQGKNGRSA